MAKSVKYSRKSYKSRGKGKAKASRRGKAKAKTSRRGKAKAKASRRVKASNNNNLNKNNTKNNSKKNNNNRKNRVNMRGGSPAYRMHQEQGFLNTINPHARSLPLTYRTDDVVENHSNQYQTSD